MGRPIKIKAPVGPNEDGKPALRIEFKGNDQHYFFGFRKLAREKAEMAATPFARLLVIEYVKLSREDPNNKWVQRVIQQAIKLEV